MGAATKSKGRLSAISSHRGWWRLQVFLCRRKRLIMKSHSTRIQRSCRNKANEWRVLRVFLRACMISFGGCVCEMWTTWICLPGGSTSRPSDPGPGACPDGLAAILAAISIGDNHLRVFTSSFKIDHWSILKEEVNVYERWGRCWWKWPFSLIKMRCALLIF